MIRIPILLAMILQVFGKTCNETGQCMSKMSTTLCEEQQRACENDAKCRMDHYHMMKCLLNEKCNIRCELEPNLEFDFQCYKNCLERRKNVFYVNSMKCMISHCEGVAFLQNLE